MIQPSKISRLPEALRDELNRRLADNESSRTLLPWLNALPAVRARVDAEYGSRPINRQNLSQWRAHGFAAWQLRREMLAQSRPTTTAAPTPFVSCDPADPADPAVAAPAPEWSEHLAQLLAMHYFAAISRWDGRSAAPCRPQFRALRALCREVHQLRHADHARQRLQLQCLILASQTAKTSRPTPKTGPIPTGKSAQTPAKPHIVKPRQAKKKLGPPPAATQPPRAPRISFGNREFRENRSLIEPVNRKRNIQHSTPNIEGARATAFVQGWKLNVECFLGSWKGPGQGARPSSFGFLDTTSRQPSLRDFANTKFHLALKRQAIVMASRLRRPSCSRAAL
jgi:hypothetical protein